MPSKFSLKFSGTQTLQPTGRDEAILNGTWDSARDRPGYKSPAEEKPDVGEDSQSGWGGLPGGRQQGVSTSLTQYDDEQRARHPAGPRVQGGRRAAQRPITAKFDEIDWRILELRDQGYSYDVISTKLKDERLSSISAAAIPHRLNKLKKRLQLEEDQRLDDELSDWHIGEDDKLNECFQAIDEQMRKDIARLEEKRWADVSKILAQQLGKRKYTANACKDRYDALSHCDADLPIELDEDQVGRRKKRENRIAAALQRRMDEAARKQAEEDRKRREREAKKYGSLVANRHKIMNAKRRAEEIASKAAVAEQKKRAKEEADALEKSWLDYCRAQTNWDLFRSQKEKEILHHIKTGGKTRAPYRRKDLNVVVVDEDSDEDMSDTEDADLSTKAIKQEPTDSPTMPASADFALPTRAARLPTRAKSGNTEIVKMKVTAETLLNPRSIMAIDELEALLAARDLQRRKPNESQPKLVARLATHDEMLNTTILDGLLRSRFQGATGKKGAKVLRLQEADARNSRAGQEGVRASDARFKVGYEGYAGQFASLITEEERQEAQGNGEEADDEGIA